MLNDIDFESKIFFIVCIRSRLGFISICLKRKSHKINILNFLNFEKNAQKSLYEFDILIIQLQINEYEFTKKKYL